MAVTETTTVSWGSRLGSAFKGILLGLALFILAFPLLFWNEGRTVKTMRALDEGEGACVPLESVATVDAEMEGKLVHAIGKAETKDVLTDDQFGLSVNAIRLERTVEMFQWVEESNTTTKKNMGGSETKTTTYTYKKDWNRNVIDSSTFKEPGHDNPAAMDFTSGKLKADNVTLGAYHLNEEQIGRIGRAEDHLFPTNFVCPIARVQIAGKTIYVPNAETRNNPLNMRDVATQPRIGDLRVTFRKVLPHNVSIVAKQRGDGFVAYTAKNGKKISMLSDGERDAAEMFASAQSGNTMMCWIVRLLGFFLMYLGLSMVFRPLSVLADVLPILGTIVGMGTGFVASVIALVCTLVTVAVAWIFYRPVLAVALLVAAGVGLWFLVQRKPKAAPAN